MSQASSCFFPLDFEGNMILICGRRGGLMVSAPDSGSSGPSSSPGRGHLCCVLGQDTLLS